MKKTSKIALFIVVILLAPSVKGLCAENGRDTLRARYQLDFAGELLQRSAIDSSLKIYREAGNLWGRENIHEYLQCQIGITNCLLRKGEYNEALLLLNALPSENISQWDYPIEWATIKTLVGFCYYAREEFSQAETCVRQSMEMITQSLGDRHEMMGSACYTMGLIQKAKGAYPSAISFMKQALDIHNAQLNGVNVSTANTLTMLGSIYDDQNEFERAIECYLQADTVYHTIGQTGSTQAASCYLNLMSSYNNKGDYHSAIENGKKVIDIYTTLELFDHANVASALTTLGEVYANMGDVEKAKEHLMRSMEIFSVKHPQKRSALGMVYQLLGGLYNRIGDNKNALKYSKKGVSLFEQAYGEFHPQVGFMYELTAGVYKNIQLYDKAIHYYSKALIARKQVVDSRSRNDIAALHTAMAHVYLLQKNLRKAQLHLDTAWMVDSASIEFNIPQRAQLLQRFGEYFDQKKDDNRSLSYYHRAIQTLGQTRNSGDVFTAPSSEGTMYKKELLELLIVKAKVFEKRSAKQKGRKELFAAFEHYQKAMDVLDDVRKQYSSDASKLQLTEQASSVYRNGCRVALQLFARTNDAQFKEAAFLIVDRSKGNVLLERLFENEARHFAGIPDSILQIERQLLTEIEQLEMRLSRSRNTDRRSNLSSISQEESRYYKVKLMHQNFVELLEKHYPKYFKLKYSGTRMEVRQLQEQLDIRTALIEFMVDDKSIYAFSVTKQALSIQTIKNTEKIRTLTQQFTASLKTYDTQTFCRAGYELYNSLFRPLEKSLSGIVELKIIPDGFLHYLPFEALPSEQTTGHLTEFTTMQYLISRFDITYTYSAAFSAKINDQALKNSAAPSSFVGFAPVFKDTINNSNFFAHRAEVIQSGLTDARSITLDGKTFNELKFSEDEVESIEQTLNSRDMTAKKFLFETATEENFKHFAPMYDIVHVATHGFINEVNPKFSAIVFSQPKSSDTEDDGILYVNETFNLNLKAKLVVLSSCESGIGKLINGEGMIALSRGLFYAGAQNIIYSLWKVSDKQTYHLMNQFYRNIAAGSSYSSSLRAAKMSMIASLETAFPAKWSGFVLVGQ
ncbi:MAG: CHAT domain-containing tetratricopeptide repeat protein [Bacteriovoracaceae bacterium]|nr:CHAT domain-containing protein [Bacteroidota bacterium]